MFLESDKPKHYWLIRFHSSCKLSLTETIHTTTLSRKKKSWAIEVHYTSLSVSSGYLNLNPVHSRNGHHDVHVASFPLLTFAFLHPLLFSKFIPSINRCFAHCRFRHSLCLSTLAFVDPFFVVSTPSDLIHLTWTPLDFEAEQMPVHRQARTVETQYYRWRLQLYARWASGTLLSNTYHCREMEPVVRFGHGCTQRVHIAV